MSAQPIIEALEQLIKLHQGFNKLASKKKNIIIEGDTDALTALLIDEQKYVKAISQIETKRQEAVQTFLKHQQNATLNQVMEEAQPEEAEVLQRLKIELLEEVTQLKEQNEFNQQLLVQSLQFINLSLDVLRPQDRNYNYGNEQAPKPSSSMFDSKA
ncbi:flagellar protein FlgN [Peribacillus asahii]|uniref:flagellar protein FlgN n=1 Tax=Peribacillus asahii TaxID=228899 RepID=UPI00207A8E9A|nr:flagellar protein FlgN [Peribacillus asahii]USK69979.1 flagellar protein FlgN [Peribacillus asahii]